MKLPVAALILCAAASAAIPARAQTDLYVNTGTFVDYVRSYPSDSVDFRRPGQVGAGYNGYYTGSPNVVMTQPSGTWSTAQNYENGAYTLSFTAPNPAAVSVRVGGMFSALAGATIVGNTYTATFTLRHDNPNDLLSGGGEIDLMGNVSAANPVSDFRVVRPGGHVNNLTPLFTSYLAEGRGVRWMNNNYVNNNQRTMTAADLIPAGQNIDEYGNSAADIGKWTGDIGHQKSVWVNMPVGADAGYVQGFIHQLDSTLPQNMEVKVEYGNENWNFAFRHPGTILALAQQDPRVQPSDNFTMVAREAGLRTMDMYDQALAQWKADGRDPANLAMVFGSQGANQFFTDQAKGAIRSTGRTLANAGLKYQAVSVYPGDHEFGSAGSVDELVAKLYADLPRVIQNLRNDTADAQASGQDELVYEWSPNGYLTDGLVPQSVVDAFRADPRSEQWTIDLYNAIRAANPKAAALFTAEGDTWGPQINPRDPWEYEQRGIASIAQATTLAPEPAGLAVVAIAAWILSRRPPRRRMH